MGKLKDLTGKRIGSLYIHYRSDNQKWHTECENCGRIKDIRAWDLNSGKITTCTSCKKIINIRGQVFGLWKVLRYCGKNMWLCQCSCENNTLRLVNSSDLRSGHSTSCGCKSKVIKYVGDKKWLCRCKCGNERVQEASALKRGLTHKCKECQSKLQTIDLTDRDFGFWHVIGPGDKKGYWRCKCKCGRIRDVEGYSLRAGKSTNCGCSGIKSAEQVTIFSDLDLLAKHLEDLTAKLGHKPTSHEIADSLGVTYNSVNRKIKDLEELKKFIQIGACGQSKEEKEIYDFVKQFCYDAESHNRSILNGNELDIYIPSKKIAIEFNGNYWHSTIFKDKRYHQNKTIECAKKGIRLIHIFGYEWNNEESQDKIKEIIKISLGMYGRKIYARDTVVQEIPVNISRDFLNKYHLQNYTPSSINLGMYSNGELIGVMTFGTPRFTSEYEYELLRLCFKHDIIVVGGAEKMFKHFEARYNPKNILCYANIAKFTGSVYTKLGFKCNIDSITEPNYIWTNSQNDVISRYRSTKKKLEKLELTQYGNTEDEIMENLGYFKIYDSGNLRFTWENNK